jgi:hypothetical protein
MPISQFSFANNKDGWKDGIGFQARLSLSFDYKKNEITVHKGSMVYGFKDNDKETHGFVIDNDEMFDVSEAGTYYILMDKQGRIEVISGSYNNVRGIGYNAAGIPWYTYNDKALIGKVFKTRYIMTGYTACDDPFWCEFEGGIYEQG